MSRKRTTISLQDFLLNQSHRLQTHRLVNSSAMKTLQHAELLPQQKLMEIIVVKRKDHKFCRFNKVIVQFVTKIKKF